MLSINDYDIIISHGPGCFDGATAAWLLFRLLPEEEQAKLNLLGGFYNGTNRSKLHINSLVASINYINTYKHVFVFCQPNDVVPARLINNKRVLILDVDLGFQLVNIVESSTHTTLIDHHESSIVSINNFYEDSDNPNKLTTIVNTSINESAASLVWKNFYNDPIPNFIEIIRIGDNWDWSSHPYLKSRLVLKTFYSERCFKSFYDIEQTYKDYSKDPKYFIEVGEIISSYESGIIAQSAKQCDVGFINTRDGKTYTVAYVQSAILVSEIGMAIRYYAEQRYKYNIDFCAVWKYVPYKNLVSVSLRCGNKDLDLSQIAANITNSKDGGGHRSAANFSFYGIENLHNVITKSKPNL